MSILAEAGDAGMPADCPGGVVSLLLAVRSMAPEIYHRMLSLQRLAGHSTLFLAVSIQTPAGSSRFYTFMVNSALDLSPFPMTMAPMLEQFQWHDLAIQPSEHMCVPSELPDDCAQGALGVDWVAFLVEVCSRCDEFFCYDSKLLLNAVSTALARAWALRSSGEAIPCAAGYFSALLVRSKRNAFFLSAFASVDAKILTTDSSETVLQVVFRGTDLESPSADSRLALEQAAPEQREVLGPGSVEAAKEGRTIFHTLPMGSLFPFPFDTSMLQALLSRRTAMESPSFAFEFAVGLAVKLLALGIFTVVMPGDATAEPLDASELVGAEASRRITLFVPAEFREKAVAALRAERGHLVQRPGLLQLGAAPFETTASSLPFRVFCEACIYASILFYATVHDFLLPLHPWRPCRIPLSAVFPPQYRDIGGSTLLFARGASPAGAAAHAWRFDYPPDPLGLPTLGAGEGACRRQLRDEVEGLQARAAAEGASEGRWLPDLRPEFNIGDQVRLGMSPADLKALRQVAPHQGLVRLLDKIRLKEWCASRGLEVPQVYFASNDSPEVPEELLALPAFVAKPTHLADSSYVFVMRDGVNLINRKATSVEEVREGLRAAFATEYTGDWATSRARPGVVVEELVEPTGSRRESQTTPDELRCHTVWGELLFCQWAWVSHMSRDLSVAESQGDWPLNRGHADSGVPEFATAGYVFRDGSCVLCEERPPVDWAATLRMVEGLAEGSDYLRVDVFIKEGRPVLNEVTITFYAIIGFQPEIGKELARRWLEGYQWRASR